MDARTTDKLPWHKPLWPSAIGAKNSHSDLNLKPRTLEVELAWDIIIPNICVKLH